MYSKPPWGPRLGQGPLKWTEIGPTNDPWMIWDEFETFCNDHFCKLKPEYFFKRIIHFFIESGMKMIQFKTKSKIIIQQNIYSIEYGKFNRIIHSKEFEENNSELRKRPKYGFRALLRPLFGSGFPEMNWNRSH